MTKKNWIPLGLFLLVFSATLMQLNAGVRVRAGVGIGYRGPVIVSHVRLGAPYGWYRSGFHIHPGAVVPVNAGRVDFNVRPKNSEIYVDGAFLGIADDYDGGFFGTTATLKAGAHRVKIVSPGGQVVTERIYVQPGKTIDFDLTF